MRRWGRRPERLRFHGRIAGVGTAEGTRIVVGRWDTSPFGAFADVMVQRADGHRVLLAPAGRVADFVRDTYRFDEVRVVPVTVTDLRGLTAGGSGSCWQVTAGPLDLRLWLDSPTRLGRLLSLVPRRFGGSPAFAAAADPLARLLLRGVRTRGTAGKGRREWYSAHGIRAVVAVEARWEGTDLGRLAEVWPPVGFGFGSTPRRPAVTEVTTTIELSEPAGASRRR